MNPAFIRTCVSGLVPICATVFFCISILGFGWRASAQQVPPVPPGLTPPRHHSLSLDAQLVASGGTSQPTLKQQTSITNGGRSQTESMNDQKVTTTQQHVRYSIKNFDTQPDNAQLEWYFVAKPVNNTPPGADFVFDHGSRAVAVAGSQAETQIIDSKEIQAVSERVAYIVSGQQHVPLVTGRTTQRGATSAGWMMRLVVDGHVVATQASTQHYEEIVKDEAKLKALLDHRPPADAGSTGKPKH